MPTVSDQIRKLIVSAKPELLKIPPDTATQKIPAGLDRRPR
jgi:hypothetical protein